MGSNAFELIAGAKSYPSSTAPVFHGVDLELRRGEVLVLLGPSGCGKSTLLRCLAGLHAFSSGTLTWDGIPKAESPSSRVGVVFQEPRLMPWLSVRDNVALGLTYRRNRALAASTDVDGLLADLGLSDIAGAPPGELSGGQAQRVSFARSIVTRPEILLLDEPFSALDPATRSEMQAWLLSLGRQYGLSLLLVTHDVDEAVRLADRVLLMSARPGTILRSWTRSVLADAATRSEILSHYRQSRVPPVPLQNGAALIS